MRVITPRHPVVLTGKAGPVTHFLRLLRAVHESDAPAEAAARRALRRFGYRVAVDQTNRKAAEGIGAKLLARDSRPRPRSANEKTAPHAGNARDGLIRFPDAFDRPGTANEPPMLRERVRS